MESSIISALSGLVGAAIGGIVSILVTKQSNEKDRENKLLDHNHEKQLEKQRLREKVFEECIDKFNDFYENVYAFNLFTEKLIQENKKEEILEDNNLKRIELIDKFNSLNIKRATVTYKLSYINEKKFKEALTNEFKIITNFYSDLINKDFIKYEYSMRGFYKYHSELDKAHNEAVKELENFRIN